MEEERGIGGARAGEQPVPSGTKEHLAVALGSVEATADAAAGEMLQSVTQFVGVCSLSWEVLHDAMERAMAEVTRREAEGKRGRGRGRVMDPWVDSGNGSDHDGEDPEGGE